MFQLSPGVDIQERDLTNIVPAVATTGGGFCGAFIWGPANERILVDSEKNLRLNFGAPADGNAYAASGVANGAVDWFTAAEFLGYGNNLQVVRVLGASAANATASGISSAVVENETEYLDQFGETGFSTDTGVFISKYAGKLGNSIAISICDNLGGTAASGDDSSAKIFRVVSDSAARGTFADVPSPNPDDALTGSSVGVGSDENTPNANTGFKLLSAMDEGDGTFTFYVQSVGTSFVNELTIGSTTGNVFLNFQSAGFRIKKTSANLLEVTATEDTDLNAGTAFGVWEWKSSFEGNPGTSDYTANVGGANDELHVIVYDKDGLWTGTPGTVLERFPYVSKAADAKNNDGTSNYWVDVLRENSDYVYVAKTTVPTDLEGGGESFAVNAENNTFGSFGARDFPLSGGQNGSLPTAAELVLGWNNYFADPETVDVQLLIGNGANAESDAKSVADALISIAGARRDCIAFISPPLNDVDGSDTTSSDKMQDVIEFRNTLSSTSYAVIDSGWKYRFDAYNDRNLFVPLSGDMAGLCVRTDQQADAWFSPAGLNRGQVRNVIRLAYNPTKVQRDQLYSAGINPVVSFPGEGTVLFGDKTMLSRPSAFDRINVRRLFIVLEKAIATASRYVLFEFNDEFTRSQFINLVDPFLRDVQGRQGITDYRVVCDTTNNTPQVIDSNRFVADIFIKPNRSINFIQLNFIATPTGLSFSEVT